MARYGYTADPRPPVNATPDVNADLRLQGLLAEAQWEGQVFTEQDADLGTADGETPPQPIPRPVMLTETAPSPADIEQGRAAYEAVAAGNSDEPARAVDRKV